MYGYFTHGTDPPPRPCSSGFLSLPYRLRRLPSPARFRRRFPGHAAFTAPWYYTAVRLLTERRGCEQTLHRTPGGDEGEHFGKTAPDDEIALVIQQDIDEHADDFRTHALKGVAGSGYDFIPGQQLDQDGASGQLAGPSSPAARSTRAKSPERRSAQLWFRFRSFAFTLMTFSNLRPISESLWAATIFIREDGFA